MKAGKHQLTVKRANRIGGCYIQKVDGTAPIKPTHQCNLANAQGTCPVIPDDYFGHKFPYHLR
jgi:hypothetical protein